jgi:hypothetical protein
MVAVERVTWKAIAIGLALVIGITVAGCFSAFLRYDLIGTGHLPRCALFPVMVLAALNGFSKWLFGKPLFTRAELLGIYCTILIMTGIPGQQYADYLYLGLIAPIYFATPPQLAGVVAIRHQLAALHPRLARPVQRPAQWCDCVGDGRDA